MEMGKKVRIAIGGLIGGISGISVALAGELDNLYVLIIGMGAALFIGIVLLWIANKKYPMVEMTDEMMISIRDSAAMLTLQIVAIGGGIVGAALVFLRDEWSWAGPVGWTLCAVLLISMAILMMTQQFMIRKRSGE